jgi:hypothetical protein
MQIEPSILYSFMPKVFAVGDCTQDVLLVRASP